jgi:trigger factor
MPTMHTEDETQLDIKISVKDGKTCEKIIKVEVAPEEIQKEYDHFFHEIAAKAKIPGFRPGKAPRNVLELHYKEDAKKHAVEHLITESYRQALKEKDIHPLGYPEIKDVKFDDKKLSYEAFIEIRPKVKLSKVNGLFAKKEKAELKTEDVDATLKRIQESLAQYKVVEDRGAELGDYVIADYVCTVDGKEIEKRQDDWFEIQKEDYLKGFSQQLVGVKAGDEKKIEVTFPEDFGRKEAAGKPAVFQVKVKEVKSKSLPEMNDEMAQSAGEFKTFAEMKDRIETDMRASKDQENESKYEKDLLDEFVKHNKMELPEGLVKRRAEKLMESAMQQFKQRGGTDDKFKEIQEKMREDFTKEARRQIHLAFLLEELAEKENIQVTDDDMKARYVRVAAEVRQPVEAVESYYKEHEEHRESLREQIRSEKAIEFIKQNAKQEK